MNRDFPVGRLLERMSLVAPLGLRFWDTVLDEQMMSGLTVVAAPENQPRLKVAATVSPSGIYGFAHLPGLRELENGAGDQEYWDNLTDAQRRPFVVTVADYGGRFYSFTLSVTAPQPRVVTAPRDGVYHFSCDDQTFEPTALAGAIPLFSLPARPVPPGMAVIRTEVVHNDEPAVWAVVEVRQGATVLAHGLADARGQVALFFPYPPPDERVNMVVQTWELELHTYHEATLNGSDVPDLCDILKQQEIAELTKTVTLKYGQELVVR